MPASSALDRASLYRRLQQHLDQMPVPFPPTESGVELRILERLYSPDDARVALCLSAIPERLAVIHRRCSRSGSYTARDSRAALAAALDSMAQRGLIQRIKAGRHVLYGKSVFVVGFYEAQVNRLTADLQRDVEQYFDEAFGKAVHGLRTPQLRAVPVPASAGHSGAAPARQAPAGNTTTVSLNETIPFERAVGRYDDIRAIVSASAGPFAVMNCICQQGKDLLGEPCQQTNHREHCLMLGPAAISMAARGDARYVTRDDMLAFLEQADRDGLVVEPQNTQDPMFICCCCGCCCGVLTTAKKLPRPAEFFASNYFAEVDGGTCAICGVCAVRCQMDAVAYDDGPAVVDVERCIGCGLCVTTCASEAIRLVAKAAAAVPPKDTPRLYARMYRERFGTAGLAAAVGRRLLGMKS